MKTLGTILAVLILASGCGGKSSVQGTPTPSTASSGSTAPPATHHHKRKPYAPNLGRYALRVGQPRNGQDVVTTVLAVKRPMADPYSYESIGEPGMEYMGVNIRTCVRHNSHYKDLVLWQDWIAAAANGNVYSDSGDTWNNWPSPRYPDGRNLLPGQCVAGWLTLAVPKGHPMRAVQFAPGGETVAEWRLRA